MKYLSFILFILAGSTFTSCDVRSGIAISEMEKFDSSPTPSISPTPTPEPVDPADIVEVDTTIDGRPITVDGYEIKRSINCTKNNRVMINGNDNTVDIKGVCRRVMVNGDTNKITLDAAIEYVFNGTENTLSYSRFANAKRPLIVENRPGNTIEKIAATKRK